MNKSTLTVCVSCSFMLKPRVVYVNIVILSYFIND